jgi:hypothetical protein
MSSFVSSGTSILSPFADLLIGIGRDLAATPLPHHLAYGSRTEAVRLIMSALLPTGCSVSLVHYEYHSGDGENAAA